MSFALSGGKVTVEDKKKLREFRKEKDINTEDHNRALIRVGWTRDEFEDGEKEGHKVRDDPLSLSIFHFVLLIIGRMTPIQNLRKNQP